MRCNGICRGERQLPALDAQLWVGAPLIQKPFARDRLDGIDARLVDSIDDPRTNFLDLSAVFVDPLPEPQEGNFGRVSDVSRIVRVLAVLTVIQSPAFQVADAAFQQILFRIPVKMFGEHHGQIFRQWQRAVQTCTVAVVPAQPHFLLVHNVHLLAKNTVAGLVFCDRPCQCLLLLCREDLCPDLVDLHLMSLLGKMAGAVRKRSSRNRGSSSPWMTRHRARRSC